MINNIVKWLIDHKKEVIVTSIFLIIGFIIYLLLESSALGIISFITGTKLYQMLIKRSKNLTNNRIDEIEKQEEEINKEEKVIDNKIKDIKEEIEKSNEEHENFCNDIDNNDPTSDELLSSHAELIERAKNIN